MSGLPLRHQVDTGHPLMSAANGGHAPHELAPGISVGGAMRETLRRQPSPVPSGPSPPGRSGGQSGRAARREATRSSPRSPALWNQGGLTPLPGGGRHIEEDCVRCALGFASRTDTHPASQRTCTAANVSPATSLSLTTPAPSSRKVLFSLPTSPCSFRPDRLSVTDAALPDLRL